jgi:heme-degrading monooxygenase HmoA
MSVKDDSFVVTFWDSRQEVRNFLGTAIRLSKMESLESYFKKIGQDRGLAIPNRSS